METFLLILTYGGLHALVQWYIKNNPQGQKAAHFLQTWRADGWVHGIMVSISVCLVFACCIVGAALALRACGV